MNKKDLYEQIKTGEGYTLEFKESSNHLGKEICAFANSSGGKIILGVKDDGTIKGFRLTNAERSKIQDIARNMDPAFSVSIDKIGGIPVIYVPEGKEKPYAANGHFYIRQGANSQQLRRNEIRSFFQRENQVRFDRKANTEFSLRKDFNEDALEIFKERSRIEKSLPKTHVLRNLNLITERKLNNAGVLFFCHRISKFFINSIISCVLYAGTTKTRILDKKDYDADFISNFENVLLFAMSRLKTEQIIKGRERIEKHEVPEEALRELIINAMIHRDYFSEGRTLLEIYSDRIEISNPGGLLFKKSELGKRSLSRNPLIVDLANRTRYVERLGTGIQRLKELLGKQITFNTQEDWFTAEIKREMTTGLAEGWQKKLAEKVGRKLTENQEEILNLIEANPQITKKEMSKALKISTTAIDKNILKLKKLELIKRTGPDKGGHWETTKNL